MAPDVNAPRTVTIPRWLAVLFVAGIALDILVGIALGLIAVQARNAASSARISRVTTYETCLANNDFRKADLARWDAIIQLLRAGPDSPQLQVFIAGVEKVNRSADAPRDCTKYLP